MTRRTQRHGHGGPRNRNVAGPGDDIGPVLDSWLDPPSGEMSDVNREIVEAWFTTAAVVMGRRMFDLGAEQSGWGENPPYQAPIFVPTHRDPAEVKATNITFVRDGVEAAVNQAKEVAGDGVVTVVGGANVFQQAFDARLFDEVRLHIAPVVLGDGIRLFHSLNALPAKLEVSSVVHAPDVTHVTYRAQK
jgi:dihydrofolate reductase